MWSIHIRMCSRMEQRYGIGHLPWIWWITQYNKLEYGASNGNDKSGIGSGCSRFRFMFLFGFFVVSGLTPIGACGGMGHVLVDCVRTILTSIVFIIGYLGSPQSGQSQQQVTKWLFCIVRHTRRNKRKTLLYSARSAAVIVWFHYILVEHASVEEETRLSFQKSQICVVLNVFFFFNFLL